jgi:hypothetical protein
VGALALLVINYRWQRGRREGAHHQDLVAPVAWRMGLARAGAPRLRRSLVPALMRHHLALPELRERKGWSAVCREGRRTSQRRVGEGGAAASWHRDPWARAAWGSGRARARALHCHIRREGEGVGEAEEGEAGAGSGGCGSARGS